MRRLWIGLIAAALFAIPVAWAASTFSGFGPANQPVGSTPDYVPLDQSTNSTTGCLNNPPTNCQTVQTPSTRLGQPVQASSGCPAFFAALPSPFNTPFKYEPCWDTSATPPAFNYWDGSAWVTAASFDTTNHLWVPPVGGGTVPTIASSSTTDICAGNPSFIVNVSGGTTITSFGSSCKVGQTKIVNWVGTPPPTVTYNASTLILPGATSLTPLQRDVWFLAYLGGGAWQLYFVQPAGSFSGVTSWNGRTGAVVPISNDYQFDQIGGTVLSTQLPTEGAVGSSTALAASLVAPNTSIQVTADSIVTATSLTGFTHVLGAYNQTFNGATTGAGGMDIGAIPTSGTLALYAIYSISLNTTSILGYNCAVSCPTIYQGSHLPQFYTYSALLGTLATNSTPAIAAGVLVTPYQVNGTQLTGTVLAPGIVTSSLTTVGTLASPNITTPAITGGTISSATISAGTIGTAAINGGTITSATIDSSVINSPTINSPTVATNFTFNGANFLLVGIPNSTSQAYLCINTSSAGVTFDTTACGTSAKRFKNVERLLTPQDASAALNALHPVAFNYKDKKAYDAHEHVGLLADDVAKMDPRCGIYEDGKIKNYDERCVIAYLVSDRQEMRDQLRSMKREIAHLKTAHR